MTTRVEGDRVIANLEAQRGKAKSGRQRGLFAAAHHVLGVTAPKVPHEEGDFERGGAVAQDDESTVIYFVDTAYDGQAAELHENMELNHDSGRQAKFLESSLNSERDTVTSLLAKIVQKELGL